MFPGVQNLRLYFEWSPKQNVWSNQVHHPVATKQADVKSNVLAVWLHWRGRGGGMGDGTHSYKSAMTEHEQETKQKHIMDVLPFKGPVCVYGRTL